MNSAKIHIIVHGARHKISVMKHVPHEVCCNEMSSASHAMGRKVGPQSFTRFLRKLHMSRATESKLLQECRAASCIQKTQMHAVRCNTRCGVILTQLR